jgi:GT2 family glycosyltransferase
MCKISIVTVLRNSAHIFDKFIDCIASNMGLDYELILVDNHSRKDCASFYDYVLCKHSLQDNVLFINNDKNLMFTRAVNQGLEKSSGQYIWLLNPDVYIEKDVDKKSVDFFVNHLNIGIAGYKLVKVDGFIEHAGIWEEGGDHRGRGELDGADKYNTPECCRWVTFGAAMFTRDLYIKLGTLDDKIYPHFGSDREYCDRAKKSGYDVWYLPYKLIHVYGNSCRPYVFDDLPDYLMENGKPARKIWK